MPTAPDKPKFVCHARRHMKGPAYKTYDAMLAMALSGFSEDNPREPNVPLEFFAAIRPTLSNHTNTSLSQLYEHIDQLLEARWLIDPNPDGPQPRWEKGRMAPKRYIILTHDEYVANKVGPCPEYAYQQSDDSETGIERGTKIDNKDDQPLDFAAESPKGRVLLTLKRLAGELPGKDWNEIKANAKKRKQK
jgi:hypothetical protein